MRNLGRTGLGVGILATALFAAAAPVVAFELFGVRLWGSDEEGHDEGTRTSHCYDAQGETSRL